MRSLATTILFVFILMIKVHAQQDTINTADLHNCWTHSIEEDDAGWAVHIYRPCGSKDFPMRRFRFVMDLQKDGTCDWLYLAPTDAHYMKKGTWKYDESNRELSIRDEDGLVVQSFQIHSLEKNMLVISRSD